MRNSAFLTVVVAITCMFGPLHGKTIPTAKLDQYGDPLPAGAVARMGTGRFRQFGREVLFAPDGKSLITSTGKSIQFLSAADGQCLREFPIDSVGSLLLSPDGKLLATPGSSGIHLYDLASGKLVRTFGSNQEVQAFSPDCRLLATSGDRVEVVLWDITTGKEVRRLKQKGQIWGRKQGRFTPDGSQLVCVGSQDKGICRWKVESGEVINFSDNALLLFKNLQISPDVRTLTMMPATKNYLSIVDAESGKERFQITQISLFRGEQSFAFTPDGKHILTPQINNDKGQTTITITDTQTGKVERQFTIDRIVRDLYLSPDGKVLLTRRAAAHHLWDMATGKHLAGCEGHDGEIWTMAYTHDGRQLVTGSTDGTVRSWDAETGKATAVHAQMEAGVQSISIALDDSKILGSGGGQLSLFDLKTGKETRRFEFPGGSPGWINQVALSPDGRRAIASFFSHPLIIPYSWSLTDGSFTRLKTLAQHPFTSDGNWSFGGSPLVIRDFQKQRDYRTIETAGEMEYPGVISPDNRLFVCITSGPAPNDVRRWRPSTLHIWELASGKEIVTADLPSHGDTPTTFQMVVSADGKTIAATRGDSLQVWDTASGKELLYRADFGSTPFKLAFRPDNRSVATGHVDGSIFVWDISPSYAGRPTSPKADPRSVETLWTDLAGDARKAHLAIEALANTPEVALPFLKERLRAVEGPRPEAVRKWITELDDDSYERRESATSALKKLEELVEPALRAALEGNPSLEQRDRLEQLLESPHQVPAPEKLRRLRAIQILERIGGPESQDLLNILARGAPGAWETRDARAALERWKSSAR